MRKASVIIILILLLTIPAAARINGWTEPSLSASPSARSGHAMANLNGEIYIFGGEAGDLSTGTNRPVGMVLNDLWKLNGEQAAWEEQQAALPPESRTNHAVIGYNGKLYALFGQDSAGTHLSDVWQYNPSTTAWVSKNAVAPSGARAMHSAVVAGGEIYILGGQNTSGGLASVWAYNPGTNVWKQKTDMPYALSGHTSVNYNGQIYTYGNSYLLKYNPAGNSWTELQPASMPPTRTHHIATLDYFNGIMTVYGGETPEGVELSDIWEYNIGANVWSYSGDMPIPLTQSAGALLPVSTGAASQAVPQAAIEKLVIFGGLSGGAPTNRTFEHLPDTTYRIYLPLIIQTSTDP